MLRRPNPILEAMAIALLVCACSGGDVGRTDPSQPQPAGTPSTVAVLVDDSPTDDLDVGHYEGYFDEDGVYVIFCELENPPDT